MTTTRKHYVVFYSPGTFFAEISQREISEWDTRKAMVLAAEVRERHDARPYGFRFETRIVADDVPDGEGGTMPSTSKTVEKSGMHYINGKVETLEQVKACATKDDDILVGNIERNGYKKLVTTANGYGWTQPYEPGQCVVDADGTIVDRYE